MDKLKIDHQKHIETIKRLKIVTAQNKQSNERKICIKVIEKLCLYKYWIQRNGMLETQGKST